MQNRSAKVLVYLWIALLAFSFYFSVRTSYRQSLRTEEFAYSCDSFGYLQMAKDIRRAFSRADWPDFKLESKQTRLLIDFMKQKNRPVSRWEEVVAPHAHHYFPGSQYVGVQYPPGTGLLLALFPQGEAIYDLNRMVVFGFLVIGALALVLAAWKRAWSSIGLVVLALSLGLMVLGRLGSLSFSMNAVLAPILLTCLFSLVALWFQTASRDRLALLLALLAGTSLGFATLIRLPSFLLAPGFLILLGLSFRDYRNLRVMSLPIVFAAGVTITGVIPVLINQHDVAGAWYHSTYASVDSAPPTLVPLRANLSYFLGHGPGSVDNWAVVFALLGFVGFLMIYSRRDSEQFNGLGLSWKRLAFAAFILWIIPICYFLTHWTTAPYYMTPAIFASIVVAGFGALGIEATNKVVERLEARKVVSWIALLLILSPGVATFKRAWSNRRVGPAPEQASTHAPILLPSELVDDRAWIWADLLTGSLWYYANKPAFKIHVTDAETRAMLFKFVFDRGERQYVIDDSDDMKKHMTEIEQMGGKLELRGKVDGNPYFLVNWPSEGPR